MFENKLVNGIHASRYIASWVRSGGALCYGEDYHNFYRWLLSMDITEEDAKYIKRLAENGKLELETSAEMFIKELPPMED